MKILELNLDGMGCFSDAGKSFDFNSNRIVVLGPNEAGKSTLIRSIGALLFGFDTPAEETRWKPWGKCSRFGGRIQFETNGKCYILDREWGVDNVKLSGDDRLLYEGEVSRGKTGEPFRQILSEVLPLSRSEFFGMLSFIKQEELQTNITEDLRERITGSRRLDALNVLENLHDKYSELTWEKPPWGTKRLTKMRLIEELQSELENKRQRRRLAQEIVQRGVNSEQQLQKTEKRIAEAEKELEVVNQVLNRLENFSKWLSSENQAKQTVRKLREERERVEQFDKTVTSLKAENQEEYYDLLKMPSDTGELIRTYFEREGKEKELALELEFKRKRLTEIEQEGKLKPWFHVVLPLGLSIVVVGITGMVLGKPVMGAVFGTVVGALISWIWALYRNKSGMGKLEIWQEEVDRINHQLEAIARELNRLQTQLSPIVEPNQPDKSYRRWESFVKMQRELRDAEKSLQGNRPLENIKNEHETAQTEYLAHLRRLEDATTGDPYLTPFQKNPGELAAEVERKRSEKSKLDKELETLKSQREELRFGWAKQVAGGIDDIETLDMEIQSLEKQLADYQRQKQAMLLANECLDEAIAGIRDEHRGNIELQLNKLFQTWTGNIHRKIFFDDEWTPSIADPQNPKVAPEVLSRGTQDQLYLAYRVALSEALSQDILLPFLLDDPFVHFDPDRRKLARKAFETISERHQVILFTQDPSFQDWGKVIAL